MKLTTKEKDFCRYYLSCQNAREAAARAGYLLAERTGSRLLEKDIIADEIERLIQERKCNPTAADGLRRIAFGSIADAVKLAVGIFDENEIDKLDLFLISEIKRSSTGTVEIKFFDRIRALEGLLETDNNYADDSVSEFVGAIFKGASAIDGVERSEQDEV